MWENRHVRRLGQSMAWVEGHRAKGYNMQREVCTRADLGESSRPRVGQIGRGGPSTSNTGPTRMARGEEGRRRDAGGGSGPYLPTAVHLVHPLVNLQLIPAVYERGRCVPLPLCARPLCLRRGRDGDGDVGGRVGRRGRGGAEGRMLGGGHLEGRHGYRVRVCRWLLYALYLSPVDHEIGFFNQFRPLLP